jgi:pimeloyl-ACP methyl ester carboxylesterase
MIIIASVVTLSLLALLAVATLIGTRVIARSYPPAGRFVEVGGGRLHVVDIDQRAVRSGDDPPVVLLHGATGNLEDMRLALADRLAKQHRVILFDRPGHGWSERAPGDASPARQAAMVSEALERLDVGRVILVAHSFAGSVATALALDDPLRVTGLVLLAPAVYPWPTGVAWYYNVATTPVLGPLFVHTVALPLGTLLMGSVSSAVFAPQEAPERYAQRAAIPLVLRPQTFLANARDVVGLNAFVTAQAPRYPRIMAPTVIITGDRDTIVSPKIHAQALAKVLPHGRLEVLKGVGHMPHHVAPDRVAAAVEEVAAQAAHTTP